MINKGIMIGVDGGGTKTEFAVFDREGNVLKQIYRSASNASLVGTEKSLDIFTEVIDSCVAEFGKIEAIYLGIAGSKLDIILETLKNKYPDIHMAINSDGVNAFNSEKGDIALICGTGSILITKDTNGEYRFVGGWGAKIGDPGSGYNFGIAALRYAFAYEDGIFDDGSIYKEVLEKTGLPALRANIGAWYDTTKIAALAPIIFDAYKNGSEVAKSIITAEMKKLSEFLLAAFPGGGRLIACGSIMKYNASVLIPLINEYTDNKFEIVIPKLPPIFGACVACLNEIGIEADDSFKNKFSETYTQK